VVVVCMKCNTLCTRVQEIGAGLFAICAVRIGSGTKRAGSNSRGPAL
jgi:hypothetical protein